MNKTQEVICLTKVNQHVDICTSYCMSVLSSRRLSFFGHLARMDENADASQVIFEPPPESWRHPPVGDILP